MKIKRCTHISNKNPPHIVYWACDKCFQKYNFDPITHQILGKKNPMPKYKCPKCKKNGFWSIYYPVCTDCANQIRYEKHELSRQYYPDNDKKVRPLPKRWWEFWK